MEHVCTIDEVRFGLDMLARAMDEALIFADDGSICVSGEINVSAEVEKHMRSLHWTYDAEIKSWCALVHG